MHWLIPSGDVYEKPPCTLSAACWLVYALSCPCSWAAIPKKKFKIAFVS